MLQNYEKGNKRLIFHFTLFIVLFLFCTAVIANDNGSIFHYPAFSDQPQLVPAWSLTTGDLLIDNLEYLDSPHDHGWTQQVPSFPFYGLSLGYLTNFETIIDQQEGSRVLYAHRPSSEFLLSTEYEKFFITKHLLRPNGSPGINIHPNLPDNTPILSFKWWAPIGMESWDIFELQILGTTLGEDGLISTEDDHTFIIKIMPKEPSYDIDIKRGSSTANLGDNYSRLIKEESSDSMMTIEVDIGRGFNSGTWHVIWLDLNKINKEANNGSIPPGWELGQVTHIKAGGSKFKLDDIIFRRKDIVIPQPPDLMEIGARYAQLFEPYRFLLMAEYQSDGEIARITDLLLDSRNFITGRSEIIDAWIKDSEIEGIVQVDPNYLDPNHPLYGQPEPYYSRLLGRDFIIDINLPLFADPAFRIGGNISKHLLDQALVWKASVGYYAHKGTKTILIEPLPIDPYDGMPTYIMLYYYSAFSAIHSENRFPSPSFGLGHYGTLECYILESAMWNAGFTKWPNIAFMDYTPQVVENLIVTVEVTNGIASDVETFPIYVVNYPIENYSPVVQRLICARLFPVGKEHECLILFADPDSFIFSLSQFEGRTPATSHLPALLGNEIRDDQDNLIYSISVNGLPSYQYGPWSERMIDPFSGLTTLTPKFEGTLFTIITCTDNFNGISVGSRPIYTVNEGTFLNHAPLIVGAPKSPQITKAGQEFFLSFPRITAIDPDGEPVYVSCNIGSIGKTIDGRVIWTIHTSFSGLYNVELIFYDAQGAYRKLQFLVDVVPWWSD